MGVYGAPFASVAAGIGVGTQGRAPKPRAAPVAIVIGRKAVQSSPLNGAPAASTGPVTTSEGVAPHVVFTFQT